MSKLTSASRAHAITNSDLESHLEDSAFPGNFCAPFVAAYDSGDQEVRAVGRRNPALAAALYRDRLPDQHSRRRVVDASLYRSKAISFSRVRAPPCPARQRDRIADRARHDDGLHRGLV